MEDDLLEVRNLPEYRLQPIREESTTVREETTTVREEMTAVREESTTNREEPPSSTISFFPVAAS